MLDIDGVDIDTVEGAEKYLKEQGVNIDAVIKKAVDKIKMDKAYEVAKDNNKVPEDYCRWCKQTPCERANMLWPGEEEDD